MKKVFKVIGGILLLGLVIAGTAAGLKYFPQAQSWVDSILPDLPSTSVTESPTSVGSVESGISNFGGMTVKSLSIGVDGQGHVTKTVSYTVTPANATDQTVSVHLTNEASTTVTGITASVNQTAKTITFTNLAAFDSIIYADVISSQNPTAHSVITFNYFHRLNDVSFAGEIYSKDWIVDQYGFLEETWGTGTKYYGTQDVDENAHYEQVTATIDNSQKFEDFMGPNAEADAALCKWVVDCLGGYASFTADSLAAVGTGKSWQSDWYAFISTNNLGYFRSALDDDRSGYFSFTLGGKITVSDLGYTTETLSFDVKPGVNIYVNLSAEDFSAYYTSVTAITPEIGTIDF